MEGQTNFVSLFKWDFLYIFILLDFSKAFDTVRQSSLLHKLAQLNFPDHICNWLANFFCNDCHCTLFHDQQSFLLDITSSIIQGSAVRPATYVVTAGDLTSCVSGNFLCKYADDTNLIIPASNESSRHIKLVNIQYWAKQNNLKINCDKSCEIVFTIAGGCDGMLLNCHHCQESCVVGA